MALPYYLRISFRYSLIGWAPPLTIALLDSMWTGLTRHRLGINRISLEFALTFGGFFFLSSRPWVLTFAATGAHKRVP